MSHSHDHKDTAAAAETIQAWIVLRLSETFGVAPSEINTTITFDSLGLDSLNAFNLTGDLADWLGCDLPATLLWDYPTISTLSHRLAEDLTDADAARLHDQLQRVLVEINASTN